ncbi:MAG: hypothetical protein PWQ56_67 [Patescibacteria group bacterium]|nr:hypothetical protein [Patescibacteria group bacterium]
MKKIQLKNIIWKEGEYYVAQCLNVDISSFGDNKKDALNNLNEALELYFEDEKGSSIAEVKNPELFTSSLNHV